MRFGQRRAAVAAVVMVCGAMALVSFVSAQTLDRDFRYDVFRAPGAGSEIGVSVRELSNGAPGTVLDFRVSTTGKKRHCG